MNPFGPVSKVLNFQTPEELRKYFYKSNELVDGMYYELSSRKLNSFQIKRVFINSKPKRYNFFKEKT